MDSSFSSQEKQQIRSAAKALSDAIDCVTIMEVSSNSRYEVKILILARWSNHFVIFEVTFFSNIKFKSKIKVTKSGGCWSYIGRVQNRAGYQALSLGRGCVQKGKRLSKKVKKFKEGIWKNIHFSIKQLLRCDPARVSSCSGFWSWAKQTRPG